MRAKVYNRFRVLLAEKEVRDGHSYSYESITCATGIAGSSLSAWATNRIKRYDANTIAALCYFFDCNVGDLIVFEREK